MSVSEIKIIQDWHKPDVRRAWRYFLSSFGGYSRETETFWRPLRWAVRDTWDWWWRRPSLEEIVTATVRNRSPQLLANIAKHNPLLARMLKDKP